MPDLKALKKRVSENRELVRALRRHSSQSADFEFQNLAVASRHGLMGPWAAATASGKTMLRSVQARWARMLNLTIDIRNALDAQHIPHVILKGVVSASAWTVSAMRPQSDVDVLVAPGDVTRAGQSLVDAHLCEPLEASTAMHARFPVIHFPQAFVEVHGKLSDDFEVMDTARLVSNRVTVEVEGESFPALALAPRMAHLLLHAATHACYRYLWLVDLAEHFKFLSERDWKEVVSLARAWNTEHALWWALVRTEQVTGMSAPAKVVRSVRPSRQRRLLIEGLAEWAEADEPHGPVQKAFRLALQKRGRIPIAVMQAIRRLVTR